MSIEPSLNYILSNLPRKGLQLGEHQSRLLSLWALGQSPLDPLEPDPVVFSRTTALLLSVSHLVLVTRNACHLTGGLDWIDQSLSAAEEHLEVLREAALASEPDKGLPGPEGFLQEQSAI